MSVKVMSAVYERYPGGGGEFAVALALADHAQDDGTRVYPTVAHLARKVRLSPRTVQYHLRKMQQMGWLLPVRGGRRGGADADGIGREYRISLDWIRGGSLPSPEKEKGVQIRAGDDPSSIKKGVQIHAKSRPAPEEKGVQSDAKRGAIHDTPIQPQEPSLIPPIPPKGAPEDFELKAQGELLGKAPRKRGEGGPVTFAQFLADCRAAGIKPIPPGDPVFVAASQAGIPDEMLVLAWYAFKRRYGQSKKRQSDWRQKFRNSVEGSWFGLWYVDADGECRLTTRGKQAERLMEAEQQETSNGH